MTLYLPERIISNNKPTEHFVFHMWSSSMSSNVAFVLYKYKRESAKVKNERNGDVEEKGNKGFARQPFCMAGTMKMFFKKERFFFHKKKNRLFPHALWLP